MATDQITLTADIDRAIGSRSSRRLRREGKIPAVVYGAGDDPTSVAVEWSDLRAALTTPAGLNALITLEFGDTERLTIVKDMQRHPVRRDVTHVDFIIIDRDMPSTSTCPSTLENTDADQLKELVVDQQMFSLAVSAKPGSIPNEFVVDCAELTLDEPIRAGSLACPPVSSSTSTPTKPSSSPPSRTSSSPSPSRAKRARRAKPPRARPPRAATTPRPATATPATAATRADLRADGPLT